MVSGKESRNKSTHDVVATTKATAVYENDLKGNRSRQIGKTSKTTTLHVHHNLYFISLLPPNYFYVKFPSTQIYKDRSLLAPDKDELFFSYLIGCSPQN